MANKYVYCYILLLLIVFISCKPLKQSKIVMAINCGLKEGFTKSQDIKYQHDANIVTGKSVDVDYHSDSNAQQAEIKFAMDKEIFMFERHTYTEMTYSLPIRNGVNTLILKFAQMYFQKSGQRVFNIKIGETIVVENMDVYAKTGAKYAAHQEYIEVEVKNGAIFYKGIEIVGGVKNGQIQLTFSKGKADNPIIQGIIVYNGPISQTTQEDYLQMKKNWGSHQELIKARKEDEKIKERLATIKKKQKIVIRNDQLLIQESNSAQETKGKREKFGTIRSFLMSPIGILIWAAAFVWQFIFLYNKFFMVGRTGSHQQIQHQHRD